MLKRDFYDSDLAVAGYDLLTEQANRQIAGDVAFYRAAAGRFGGPVLELGVGTGRIAWALAAAGHAVVGLDRSAGMLDAARRKGADHDATIRKHLQLIQADIAAFDLGRSFALALIPFSTFQHLTTPARQRACLTCLRRHLVEGGRAILDLFDPILEACAPGAPTPNPEREAIEPESGHRLRRRSIARRNDPLTQSVFETFRLERWSDTGELIESDEASHHLRWATRQEMIYLFELTGFAVEAEHSDFDARPPAYGKRQIWTVRAV